MLFLASFPSHISIYKIYQTKHSNLSITLHLKLAFPPTPPCEKLYLTSYEKTMKVTNLGIGSTGFGKKSLQKSENYCQGFTSDLVSKSVLNYIYSYFMSLLMNPSLQILSPYNRVSLD